MLLNKLEALELILWEKLVNELDIEELKFSTSLKTLPNAELIESKILNIEDIALVPP